MAHPRVQAALVAALCLLAAAPGAAQEIRSPYRFIENGQEAGVVVGYMGADPGQLGLGPDGGLYYGGIYSIALGGLVSVGGSVTFLPTERDVVDPRRAEGNRVLPDAAEVALMNVSVRLRFNLTGRRTWNSIQPYAVLGGGLMFDVEGDQVEDQELEESQRFDFGTAFSGLFGGGARLVLSERLALRGEVAVQIYQIDTPDGWFATELGLGDIPDSEWVNSGAFSVGASFMF